MPLAASGKCIHSLVRTLTAVPRSWEPRGCWGREVLTFEEGLILDRPSASRRYRRHGCYTSETLYLERCNACRRGTLRPDYRAVLGRLLTSSFLTEEHYRAFTTLFESLRGPKVTTISFFIGDQRRERHLVRIAHAGIREMREVQELMEASDIHSQNFLQGLSGLLACKRYAVGEDQMFVSALEFWSTFVETMIDSTYSDSGETPV